MKSLSNPGLILLVGIACSSAEAATTGAPSISTPVLKQYCFSCHGAAATAGINLEQMTANASVSDNFAKWQKVAAVLEEKRMPPAKMPQPTEPERQAVVSNIRASLKEYALKHDGEPGG